MEQEVKSGEFRESWISVQANQFAFQEAKDER